MAQVQGTGLGGGGKKKRQPTAPPRGGGAQGAGGGYYKGHPKQNKGPKKGQQGTYTYDPSHPGTSTVTVTQNGTQTYHRTIHTVPAWIVRRQQILKRAGFLVTTDGVWGPTSQAAWNAWTAGQHAASAFKGPQAPGPGGRKPELPKGFAYLHGQVVTAQAAKVAAALESARKLAKNPTVFADHGGERRIVQAKGAGKLAYRRQLDANVQQILGRSGAQLAHRGGRPETTMQHVARTASLHDINVLIGAGVLKPNDSTTVAIVQHALQRSGYKVRADGVFDNSTANALQDAYHKEAAAAYQRGLANFTKAYEHGGFGDFVSKQFYGKHLTADQLYVKFAQGGPTAVHAAVGFGQMFQGEAVLRVEKEISHRRAVVLQHQHAAAHRSHSSIWGEILAPIGTALGWTGRQGAHAVWSANIYATDTLASVIGADAAHALDRANQLVGNFILPGSIGMIGEANGFNLAGYVSGPSKYKYNPAYISPHDAWYNGWTSLSETEEHDPLRAAIVEGLYDPLNVVGFGEVTAGVRLGFRGAVEVSARGLAATDRAGIGYRAAHGGFQLLDDTLTRAAIIDEYSRGVVGATRMAKWYSKATLAKADAIARVNAEIREIVVRGFHAADDLVPVSGLRTAASGEAGRLARHVTPDERLAAADDLASKAITAVPDDLRAELDDSFANLSHYFATDTEIIKIFDSVKTPIYRHQTGAGGAGLSRGGHWLQAAFMENGTRAILSHAAKLVADGDAELESRLLHSAGTYSAGHADYRLLEIADPLIERYRRQLNDHLLPMLHAHARDSLPPTAWDDAGFYIDEGTDEQRSRFEDAFETYISTFRTGEPDNLVRVRNPNHLIRLPRETAQKLQQIELDARLSSVQRWMDDAAWAHAINPDDAKIARKARHAETEGYKKMDAIRKDVREAWRVDEKTGLAYDSRATFDVARGNVRRRAAPSDFGPGKTTSGYHYLNEAHDHVEIHSPDGVVANISSDGKLGVAWTLTIRQGDTLLGSNPAAAKDFYDAALRWVKEDGRSVHIANPTESWRKYAENPANGWQRAGTDGYELRVPEQPKKTGDDAKPVEDYSRKTGLAPTSAPGESIYQIAQAMLDLDGAGSKIAALMTERERLVASASAAVKSHVYKDHWLFLQSAKYSQSLRYRAVYYGLQFGLSMWKFATLALRPAYVVKNTIDNFAKALIRGLHDPRLIFNADGHSIFEHGSVRALRWITHKIDAIFGTNVGGHLDSLLDDFYKQNGTLLKRIFGEHGIPFPPELLEDHTIHIQDLERVRTEAELRNLTGVERHFAERASRRGTVQATRFQRFQDAAWEMMGSRPENYAKRSVYVHAYNKALAKGRTDLEAMDAGLAEVHHTLFNFDAEHTSVLEDQLRVVFPFISFWRNNAHFWGTFVGENSRIAVQGYHLYGVHDAANQDYPANLRRYVSASPLGGLVSDIPGAGWMGEFLKESYTDPLNLLSMGSYYRAFKTNNQYLPENEKGNSFLAPVISSLQDIGLTGNPFWIKTGETLGLLDRQSWQNIFPFTSVIQGITQYLGVGGNTGINIEHLLEDATIQQIDKDFQAHIKTNRQITTETFNQYVNRYIASRVAVGETISRSTAEEHIRQWFGTQQMVLFTTGVAFRQLNDTDISFASLREQMAQHPDGPQFFDLTPDEQDAYRLWKRYHINPAKFDAFRIALEGSRAYYQIDDYNERQQFLQDHPDVQQLVNQAEMNRYAKNPQLFIQHALLNAETGATFDYFHNVLDNPSFDAIRHDVAGALITPQLRAYWAKNDTVAELRQRQARASYYHYVTRMQSAYFAIPATDYDKKNAYLQDHPELTEWWARNDTAGDDYRSIFNAMAAPLRDVYFNIVETGNWDAATQFLSNHSFIFDQTSAEGRVTPGGNWMTKSQAQQDYAKVADKLATYYDLDAKAQALYRKQYPLVAWYLNKYSAPGGLNAEAEAYDKIRTTLDGYFRLPKGALREAYLNHHPELRTYFSERGTHRKVSQHARDYLAVKEQLDAFFALDQSQQAAYLAKHPEVQAYFDKYGHHSTHSAVNGVLADNPEIAKRYDFWMHFFSLNPKERAKFVHTNAAKAGIFIYGNLSYNELVRQEEQWHREAVSSGHSERGVVYRHIKPLMDIYFGLKNSSDKQLFLETNPELSYYFEHFAKVSNTVPPQIAKQLKEYFRFQPYSDDRKQYLADHPELSHYFSNTGSASEQAIFTQVEQFFKLPFGKQRNDYLARHPELGTWFDQRAAQKQAYMSVAAAFNDSDPRMRPFYAQYHDIIYQDFLKRWQLAHQTRSHNAGGIDTRRDRTPTKTQPAGWHLSTS